MAANTKWIMVVGKVFPMIKIGLGFMVSQMHSLFNKVVDNGTLEFERIVWSPRGGVNRCYANF